MKSASVHVCVCGADSTNWLQIAVALRRHADAVEVTTRKRNNIESKRGSFRCNCNENVLGDLLTDVICELPTISAERVTVDIFRAVDEELLEETDATDR